MRLYLAYDPDDPDGFERPNDLPEIPVNMALKAFPQANLEDVL
jgi:hypothetical protein